MKKRVSGLGGVFFKTRDPEGMKAWYNKHLHLDAGEYGAMFKWRDHSDPEKEGNTVWSHLSGGYFLFPTGKKGFYV